MVPLVNLCKIDINLSMSLHVCYLINTVDSCHGHPNTIVSCIYCSYKYSIAHYIFVCSLSSIFGVDTSIYPKIFHFYTPVFRRDVLWYGDVRLSVRPSIRPSGPVSVRPPVFRTFLLHTLTH